MKTKLLLFLLGFGLLLNTVQAQGTIPFYTNTITLPANAAEVDLRLGGDLPFNDGTDYGWLYVARTGDFGYYGSEGLNFPSSYSQVGNVVTIISPCPLDYYSTESAGGFSLPDAFNAGSGFYQISDTGQFSVAAVPEPSPTVFFCLTAISVLTVKLLRERRISFGKLAKSISHQLARSLSVASRYSLWLCGCVGRLITTGLRRSVKASVGGGGVRASKANTAEDMRLYHARSFP